MKPNITPNLIHSMDAAHCNRIMRGGESHFPELKTQEEIDAEANADAFPPLFLGMMRLLTKFS